MSTTEPPLEFGAVEPIELQEEMERSFLDYAMSVIVERALPDARDGLKPVHRRILYGMLDVGARSDRQHMKCARVTGHVMGNFHPHGPSAIYDALARMVQDFSLRHPLIDGHGNFGSPDHPPAAERYTECRLATLANEMLAGIDEETVDFVTARELDGVADINDESSGNNTRLVVKLKRDANANVVLNNLYKHTPLQTSFGVNMVALDDGVPRTLNLVQALTAYVSHQVEVIPRRSEHRLKEKRRRAHIVEGLLKALDMIDAIIALIRGSDDKASARAGLMTAPFEFSEVQAEHILDMQLSRLTRLGRSDLESEMAKLRAEIDELEAILNDDAKLRGVIKTELGEVRDKFATPRRAEITYDPGEIDLEDLIDDEELVITMTTAGYVKSTSAGAFRTQGRGGRGVQGARLKEEDLVTRIIHTTAHAYLLFFSNRGKVYRLKAHEIPMKERTAKGTAIVNLLPLAPDERIQAIIDTRTYETERHLFFATRLGQVKKTLMSEYDKSRREGFIAINLNDGDELVRVIQTIGDDDIFMVSRNGIAIRFSEDDVRPMGRSAAGVRGMRMREGDEA